MVEADPVRADGESGDEVSLELVKHIAARANDMNLDRLCGIRRLEDGRIWSTDGRCLALAKLESLDEEWLAKNWPLASSAGPDIAEIISSKPSKAEFKADLESLAEWLACPVVVWPKCTCPPFFEACICGKVSGDVGFYSNADETVRFGESLFSSTSLHFALSAASRGDGEEISIHTGERLDAAWFCGSDWTLIAMPTNGLADGAKASRVPPRGIIRGAK